MSIFSSTVHLCRSNAPLSVVFTYLGSALARKKLRRKHAAVAAELREFAKQNSFNRDWFSTSAPFWMDIFDRQGFRDRPIRALEIGSFEGLSSCFLLRQLPNARLTCVDTWAGSDEHAGLELIAATEAAFDRHVAPWIDRVTKYKGMSFNYLVGLSSQDKFDFIYVDGSHHADDVMVDALRAFEHLNVGGVMVFDDYLWKYYQRNAENPAMAINGFLRLAAGRCRLISVYYQLAIVKTADRGA
jgi:predicted O-methyltransferase YrrM